MSEFTYPEGCEQCPVQGILADEYNELANEKRKLLLVSEASMDQTASQDDAAVFAGFGRLMAGGMDRLDERLDNIAHDSTVIADHCPGQVARRIHLGGFVADVVLCGNRETYGDDDGKLTRRSAITNLHIESAGGGE